MKYPASFETLEGVVRLSGELDFTDPVNQPPFGVATVTLTNAQIRALPTTPIRLLAAPGAGLTLVPLTLLVVKSFAAGGYTNVDPTARLTFTYNLTPTPSAAESFGAITEAGFTFFGANVFETYTVPNGVILDGNGGAGMWPAAGTDLRNLPFGITCQNGALGNFTGGNAADTLIVTAYYAVV